MPAPSYADILSAGFRGIAIRPSPFTVQLAREPESTANIVCHVNASMAEETAVYLETKLAEGQFVTAVKIGGAVLDRLIYDRYGDDFEPRRDASVSVVTLSFRRSGSVGFAIPAQSRVATEDGIVFRTSQPVVFAANDLGPLDVIAYCAVAGADGNVIAGKIVDIIDRPSDDKTLSVANVAAAAGGAPREEDGQLAARARGFWSAARKGTKSAIEYAARSVQGVRIAVASEILSPFTKLPKWRGSLVVADQAGNGNSALAARVYAAMDEARALGVPIGVRGGATQFASIAIVGLVFVNANTTAEIREQLRAAIVDDVATLNNGETLSHGLIFATLLRFKAQVFAPDDCIVTPAADQAPTSAALAIRTRADLITINGV
jgi:hypothetical protein